MISLFEMFKDLKNNKHTIQRYLNNTSIEGYKDEINDDKPENIFGKYGGVGIFLTMFIFVLVIWTYALILTVNNWDKLETWAQILAVIGLFTAYFGGPLMTIVVVMVGRKKKK